MKKLISMLLCSTILASCCSSFASEVHAPYAQVWDGALWMNSDRIIVCDNDGYTVFPLSYNSSIYIPLNTASEWLGKNWSFDSTTSTITFDGTITPLFMGLDRQSYRPDYFSAQQTVEICIRSDITVFYENQKIAMADANGIVLSPIEYSNILYVPIRSVATLGGLDVKWVCPQKFQSVYLCNPLSEQQKAQVDDYICSANVLSAELKNNLSDIRSILDSNDDKKISSVLILLKKFDNTLTQLATLSKPDSAFVDGQYKKTINSITKLKLLLDYDISSLEGGQTLLSLCNEKYFPEDLFSEVETISTYLSILGNSYVQWK